MQDTLYSFKQKSQDFVVQEELPFVLAGKGDVFFVLFEKQNLNTMDVVNHLCSAFNISRLTLGIAGLKDKKAITRQWICIYKSALKKIGWERAFLDGLSAITKVVKTDWHTEPIGMTTPIQNTFYIRLRANKKLSLKEKEVSNNKVLSLFKKWFPNLFGNQRFGVNGVNPQQGSEILQWKGKIRDKKEIVFKIQAYASKIFNEYLQSRTKKWLQLLDGDILEIMDAKNYKKHHYGVYQEKTDTVKLFDASKTDKNFFRYPKSFEKEVPVNGDTMMITGPVPWYNLLLAAPDTVAGNKEKVFFDQRLLSASSLKLCMQYKIFGIRRPLWVFPQKVNIQHQDDDILLHFTLPSWSYASIMIDELEKTLWLKWS